MPTDSNRDTNIRISGVTRRRALRALTAVSGAFLADCAGNGGDGGDSGDDSSDDSDGGDMSDRNYERLIVNLGSVEWGNEVNKQIPAEDVETMIWQNQGDAREQRDNLVLT